MGAPRHFLDLDRVPAAELRRMLDAGLAFKRGKARSAPLQGKILALLFEKPSTRTRLSFEVAMKQLGGDVVVMDAGTSQISRGETMADTARVLSRYVDAIMIRTGRAANLDELAANATVPVINGLTDMSHPCQIMADVMTLEEKKGGLAGRVVAWCGDGNNVAASCASPARPRSGRRRSFSTGRAARARASRSMTIRAPPPRAPTASSPTPGCRWGLTRATSGTTCWSPTASMRG